MRRHGGGTIHMTRYIGKEGLRRNHGEFVTLETKNGKKLEGILFEKSDGFIVDVTSIFKKNEYKIRGGEIIKIDYSSGGLYLPPSQLSGGIPTMFDLVDTRRDITNKYEIKLNKVHENKS